MRSIPTGAKRVRVGERELPAPAHDPKRIVVLGDTGCRLASAFNSQACDDPAAWPFPVIARSIAAAHPDLIVHVGDYLYRESACPALVKCAGSPHGDDEPAWFADFLAPAAPLFAAAPLLLVRGNHEECARNGTGWFRYFDPHPSTSCANETAPYAVDLGDLRLVGFDSAVAEDRVPVARHDVVYRPQFARVRELARGARTAWFLTHRPPYTNEDERAAMGDALDPFGAVLAGHIHFFAALNVAPPLPPLLINGEGGTKLDPNYAPLLGLATGPVHVVGDVFGSAHFGFAIYTHEGTGWTISLRDPDGTERTPLHARRTGRAMLIATVLSAWLQYSADGQPHARALITVEAQCPSATVDGRAVPMTQRAAADDKFDDVVCDAPVSATAASVAVGPRPLPAPARAPKTVVVFGDTGCRLKDQEVQQCNDATDWPFPTVAASIAAAHPDLIVHVGDYYYRETPCPNPRCAGPYGDTW